MFSFSILFVLLAQGALGFVGYFHLHLSYLSSFSLGFAVHSHVSVFSLVFLSITLRAVVIVSSSLSAIHARRWFYVLGVVGRSLLRDNVVMEEACPRHPKRPRNTTPASQPPLLASLPL